MAKIADTPVANTSGNIAWALLPRLTNPKQLVDNVSGIGPPYKGWSRSFAYGLIALTPIYWPPELSTALFPHSQAGATLPDADIRIRGNRIAERPHEGRGRRGRRRQRRQPHDRGAARGRRIHLRQH